MSPRRRSPGSAADWLGRAKGKLALAESPLPEGGYLEDLCFCTQQAAELAIKAVYQQYGWLFTFTHDLGNLLDRLSEHGAALPIEVLDAERLSIYAVETRYPGCTCRFPKSNTMKPFGLRQRLSDGLSQL